MCMHCIAFPITEEGLREDGKVESILLQNLKIENDTCLDIMDRIDHYGPGREVYWKFL